MTRAAFAADYNVPRGTMAKFDAYAVLLAEWQTRMNLVGPSTLEDVWDRHFADSAQLVALAGGAPDLVWLDLGSGAGFPGLVVALLAPGRFHLVEATTKKCRFLEAAVAALGLGATTTIHNARIEALPPLAADVVTARACASLAQLFAWGAPHGGRATWLLLKGRTAAAEVDAARASFDFSTELVPSRTDAQARIVVARDVAARRARRVA